MKAEPSAGLSGGIGNTIFIAYDFESKNVGNSSTFDGSYDLYRIGADVQTEVLELSLGQDFTLSMGDGGWNVLSTTTNVSIGVSVSTFIAPHAAIGRGTTNIIDPVGEKSILAKVLSQIKWTSPLF